MKGNVKDTSLPPRDGENFIEPEIFSHVRYLEPRQSCTYVELYRPPDFVPSQTAQGAAEVLDPIETFKARRVFMLTTVLSEAY